MAILKKNAENYNKQINEDVFDYIATNIKSNIRELEGAYNKVIAFSRLNKVEVTLDNVQEALKDIISPNATRQVTPQLIISIVAEHFGITVEDITSKRRNSELVQPRQICMYLCRKLTEESLQNIGKALNKKDHTTVIHGIDKITDDLQTNEELRNRIDIIMKKINPS
jgi:chromosomal replication initiator protein